MTARFGWLSDTEEIPARWDLRLIGWEFAAQTSPNPTPLLLDARAISRRRDWRNIAQPALGVAVGVDCARERADLLSAGLGEALPSQVALAELAIRMVRLASHSQVLPRYRQVGPILLDLLHRDASAAGRWLALHPREFALLWRLADEPGKRVPRERLLADVWRLTHTPVTNSLEVHVSRLRAKLAAAGAGWLVETDPCGGYRLADILGETDWTGPTPLPTVASS